MRLNIASAAKTEEAKPLYDSLRDVPGEFEVNNRVYDKGALDALKSKVQHNRSFKK